MRILFTARHYLPAIGGLQQSVHHLALLMAERGHAVAVLTIVTDPNTPEMRARRLARKLRLPAIPTDTDLGYPVFRAFGADDGIDFAQKRFRPDVVVVNAGGTRTLTFSTAVLDRSRVPTVLYLRDSASYELFQRAPGPARVLTNASYHSEIARGLGVDALTIPSIVETAGYRTPTTREVVLYVNPHPLKGIDLAWEIAGALPGIEFEFREAWPLSAPQRAAYDEKAAELGNVRMRDATDRPPEIYASARVLLVPYVDENRPRVIAEAQASGIPVVGIGQGGIPEAIGPGGIVVAPEAGLDGWTEALGRLQGDSAEYERLASEALRFSEREDMDPRRLADRFEAAIEEIVEGRTSSPSSGR